MIVNPLCNNNITGTQVWVAGAMALFGSVLLAADAPSVVGRVGAITLGDGALIAAALLWSIHILRVGRCVCVCV